MSWRDKMGPASFRGVPFFVETVERTGGRRGVAHEYPKRDDPPYIDDLGAKGRVFPIEGFVVGPDYLADRDRLLTALEQPGPGELVHPHYGTLRVMAMSYRVRESFEHGGQARFGIDFAETSTAIQPAATADASSLVAASSDAARDSVGDVFADDFDPTGQPQWAFTPIASALQAASVALSAALLPAIADVQTAAALKQQLDLLGSSAASLVRSPAALLTSAKAVFTSLDAVPFSSAGFRGMLAAYGFAAGSAIPLTTRTRQRQGANFDALNRLLRRLILIQAARTAPSQVFGSYEEAAAARDQILGLLDAQMEDVSDGAYPVLLQLRADLAKAVPGAQDLPHLLNYTPTRTVPSLVLAHSLYGDVALELDLVTRNRASNPGFLTGGRTLEVLSRA